MKIRVVACGAKVGDERMYAVQVRNWFWGWCQEGYVWARTPEDALRLAGAESGDSDEVAMLEKMVKR